MYSTYSGKVLGVRYGDNVYLTKVHSPTARRAHVFAAPPTPRAERAIVTYQGVAFAYMTGTGRRWDLPRAPRISHVQREAGPRRPAKASTVWTIISRDEANASVRIKPHYYGTVEHSLKEHL